MAVGALALGLVAFMVIGAVRRRRLPTTGG